jgi:hypothetical protein
VEKVGTCTFGFASWAILMFYPGLPRAGDPESSKGRPGFRKQIFSALEKCAYLRSTDYLFRLAWAAQKINGYGISV